MGAGEGKPSLEGAMIAGASGSVAEQAATTLPSEDFEHGQITSGHISGKANQFDKADKPPYKRELSPEAKAAFDFYYANKVDFSRSMGRPQPSEQVNN